MTQKNRWEIQGKFIVRYIAGKFHFAVKASHITKELANRIPPELRKQIKKL